MKPEPKSSLAITPGAILGEISLVTAELAPALVRLGSKIGDTEPSFVRVCAAYDRLIALQGRLEATAPR